MSVTGVKRLGIALMVGGPVAGIALGSWVAEPLAILGLAVSLAGYTTFALADPDERKRK